MRIFEINQAQRRLAVALGFSALLHAWLMESPYGKYGKGAARGGASGAPVLMAVQMLPVAGETKTLLPDQATPRHFESEVESKDDSKMPAVVATAAVVNFPRVSKSDANAALARTTTVADAMLSQPSDPTYYAAGDLDVFPKALAKPDLSAALGVNHASVAGKVRATVLIDEAGVVNAVRGVEASASEIETTARELLLRTRFTPARNKEGRIVKAQVLVALDYDTRAMPVSR